jgi:hypothetical protein
VKHCKNHDKPSARSDQQASKIMGSGWIFLFWHKGTTANIKKDKGAAMNGSPAKSKKYDKLVAKRTPEGHCSLFLYLKNKPIS